MDFVLTCNNIPLVELSHITGDIVTSYLLGLKKLNGEPSGYLNYSTHRTFICHLLRMYRASISAEFDNVMGLNFKSLKRKVANRLNDGEGSVQVGKSPIEFNLYTFIAKQFFSGSNRENVFGNCFFTLCWGLMARVGNIEAICLNHLEWENDSLAV